LEEVKGYARLLQETKHVVRIVVWASAIGLVGLVVGSCAFVGLFWKTRREKVKVE